MMYLHFKDILNKDIKYQFPPDVVNDACNQNV